MDDELMALTYEQLDELIAMASVRLKELRRSRITRVRAIIIDMILAEGMTFAHVFPGNPWPPVRRQRGHRSSLKGAAP